MISVVQFREFRLDLLMVELWYCWIDSVEYQPDSAGFAYCCITILWSQLYFSLLIYGSFIMWLTRCTWILTRFASDCIMIMFARITDFYLMNILYFSTFFA